MRKMNGPRIRSTEHNLQADLGVVVTVPNKSRHGRDCVYFVFFIGHRMLTCGFIQSKGIFSFQLNIRGMIFSIVNWK